MSQSVARKAGSASVATLLSRVTGLVREQFIAFMFGAGAATDAYNIAFRVPNLLRDLFAEGAMIGAFVPTFTARLEKSGKPPAFHLLDRVTGGLVLILGVLTLLGMVFTHALVGALASGILKDPVQTARTVLMTRILLPFLLAIALAAVAMGALNALEHFFLPAFAPVMLNVGSVVCGGALAWLAPRFGHEPITGFAVGTMIGGLLQWLVQLPALWREGYRPRPAVDFADPDVRQVIGLMAPVTVATGTTQINVLVNTQIASYLAEGSISWLAYAFRLMQLPIGIFGVSVGSATLPEVARRLARGERDAAARALEHALALVFCATLPATVILVVLARPIIGLLYEYRHFTAFAADQTASALACYSVGLAGFSAVKVLAPAYYALGETRVPVRASIAAVLLNIALSLALMGPLAHRGLALATSLNGLVNMALLLAPLPAFLPAFSGAAVAHSLARVALASTGMGGVCLAVASLTAALVPGGFAARLAAVMLGLAAGAASLVFLLRALGVREVDELLAKISRKLRSS